MSRILAITLILLGAASAAQADVYRWTDANGTVQFSDRWVPGSVLVKTDKTRPGTPPPEARAPAAPASAASPPARADQLLAEQKDRRVVQQDVEKSKAEQCKKAREAYDQAIQSRRIFKETANGQREYVSDAEADAYRAELLRARNARCGT